MIFRYTVKYWDEVENKKAEGYGLIAAESYGAAANEIHDKIYDYIEEITLKALTADEEDFLFIKTKEDLDNLEESIDYA